MAALEIGVQFWPWNSIRQLVAYGAQALRTHPFSHIWVCDEFQYEDSITTLTAMAMELDVSLGSLVTFPWRNPLDLAQRFASIAKLLRDGKEIAIGLGAGGAVQVQVIGEKRNPVSVMQESVQLLRELLRGDAVELARFPQLGSRFRYNTKTKTKLYFPPPRPVPVYLAAGGPRMYDLAGRYADGVVFSQIVARTSLAGMKRGLFKEAVELVEAARSDAKGAGAFKKIYNLHMSVARDGDKAKQWAKRNTSYGLTGAYIRYPEVLTAIGVNPEEVASIADAYLQGLGIDEAAGRVSDSLLQRAGYVVAGTPEECVGPCLEIKRHLLEAGFDHLVLGVPLGPDVTEALELLGKEVLPALLKDAGTR